MTVALLPACGEAAGFRESGLLYKALLPFNGRPLIDYVLQALQASDVERIFIIQPFGGVIEQAVTPNGKNVFVDGGEQPSSLAGAMVRGARAILDLYGNQTSELVIMVMPCDIPLVQPCEINSLLRQYDSSNADVGVLAIPSRFFKETCPERHFHTLFMRDLGGDYSLQSTCFGRGSLIGYREDSGSPRFTVYDRDGKPIKGLEAMVDTVRRHRKGIFVWPLFIYQLFIKRLAATGHLGDGFKLVSDILLRRVTTARTGRVLGLALNLKFGLLQSDSVSLSLDVDSLADLEEISRMGLSKVRLPAETPDRASPPILTGKGE